MESNTELNQYIPNILIVDDVPDNLRVLGNILLSDGYLVRQVPTGQLALQVAATEIPDLILLDIMMPGMNGFEVCKRLKEDKKLCRIPVIFISALHETTDIVNAFSHGGVDYIIKPFNAEEVKARVATHIKICQQNRELEKLNADKDKFFSIIAHDLRGPVGTFFGLTKIFAERSYTMPMDKIHEMAISMNLLATNLLSLLDNLLQWSQLQKGAILLNPTMVKLTTIVNESIATMQETAKNKGIEIVIDIPDKIALLADTNILQTVIRNLVSNAVKFTNKEGQVFITARSSSNKSITIAIKDTGIGMDASMVQQLFSNHTSSNRLGTGGECSSGLGLQLCKEFVDLMKGQIWVESVVGKGSTFYFSIP